MKPTRKIIEGAIVAFVCIVLIGAALPTKPVYAQMVVNDPPNLIQKIKEYIEKLKDTAWGKAMVVAVDKAASTFINKLAQDTGEYLATGGKGQSGLQRRESFGSILKKDGEAALGDFVQDLSSETQLDKLGLNLCNPTAQLKANISLQLLDEGKPAPLGKEGCSIRDIQENWRRFAQTAGDVNLNVSYGDQFAVSGGAGYGLPTPGTCQLSKGQCVFPDQNASFQGYCEESSSSSQQLRTYCNTSADCGGARCIITAKECSKSSECSGGTTCSMTSGGACFSDTDCPGIGAKCVGATSAKSGVPWLDITKDFSPAQKLQTLNDIFSPTQSDLGAITQITAAQRELAAAKKQYATISLQACDGYKDVGSKITDDYVHKNCGELRDLNKATGATSRTATDEELALKAQGDNSFWLNAAKIFGRSLLSGLLKKYIKAGSFSLAQIGQRTDVNQVRENIVQQLRGGVTSPLNALQVNNTLADVKRPSLDKVDHYDYVSIFSQCPDDRNIVELDNCTIDDNFASAIRDGKTVGAALADGTLSGDLPLISNLNTSLNSDPFCVRNGYCHSNIVRLRKYRIVPIGWEIAASLSPVDAPVSLKDAADCFENGGTCKFDPASNVYLHLIDPNWVLKAPETQCKAQVFGPKLLSTEVSERQKYCADGVSCLAEDDAGSCVGGFGYCTKENNIWRFNGEQCPKEYASCAVYTRTSDKQTAAYLGNSVDICDASQNGCQWYSKSQENAGTLSQPNYVWNPNDRIYFNKSVAKCELDQAGCTEYVSLLTPGVNLIPNGDFDYFTPTSTTNLADPNWMNDGKADTFDGWQGSADAYTTRDNAYYGSVGLSLKNGGRLATNAITGILADKTFVLSWFAKSGTANDCTTDVAIASATTAAQSTTVTYTKDWKRFELSKAFDVNTLDTSVNISFSSDCTGATADEVYIDGVKFELNNRSTGFTQYAENGKVYLKSQNRCTKEDVGCDVYTATDSGINVPGKIDSEDQCPAECVGYQNYLELPSEYDVLELTSVPAARSVDFIASTAAACPASEVGCEEFTNQEEVAQGGEGKYYFSYVRQCVEDALGSTYYTLEGSDTAGYQVRTWRLLASDLPSGQPCTNVNIEATNCRDTTSTPWTCTAADLATNLNCREFFDINGAPHYVLQDKVIISSADCQAFRRTSTGTTFYGLGEASRSCNVKNNNCREYRGNQSGNLRTLFSDYFEQGTVDPWDATLSLSSEAVTTGGHSLTNRRTSGNATDLTRTGKSYIIEAGREVYVDFWMKNTDPVTVTVQLDPAVPATWFQSLTVPVTSDWQQYRLGPLYLNAPVTTSPRIHLAQVGAAPLTVAYFDNIVLKESQSNIFIIKDTWKTPASCDQPIPGAMLGCQEYTNKAGATFNLRSFSKLCSNDVIGCQAFITTQNSTNPFQKIYHVDDPSEVIVPEDNISYLVYNEKNRCFSQSKGCSALGSPQLNLDLPENHPRYIDGYKVQTLINNPDTYETTLCMHDGLFCEEYTDNASQTIYFKNPRDRVCVFKENVNVNGKIVTGWFQKKSIETGDSPVGCSDDGVLPIEDRDFKIYSNTDYFYNGWVGSCSAQYDRCTEFKDPLDTQGDNILTNNDFSFADALGRPVDWPISVWPTTPAVPVNWSQVAPENYLIQRTYPYGIISNQQYFYHIDNNDVFAYSADVNIQRLRKGYFPEAKVFLSCQLDSPRDVDFCTSGLTAVDPADTCTSVSDCNTRIDGACMAGFCRYPIGTYNYNSPCDNHNSCPSNQLCYSFSWNACEGPGPDGQWGSGFDAQRADNDFTNVSCQTAGNSTDDAGCVTALTALYGPGYNNYRCLSYAYFKDKDRDLVLNYEARANQSLRNQWQTVRQVVDLGGDSGQRKVASCFLALTSGEYRYQPGNSYSGGTCEGTPTRYNMDCGTSYCSIPGPDTIVGTPDDVATTVPCTTSASPNPGGSSSPPIGATIVRGDLGCQTATGDGTAVCGGTQEVWFRNPLFKEAKSYYYLSNEEVDTQTCNGQVGKKDGCLLFLDMSKRSIKNYSAFASYDKSTGNNGALVQPVSCAPGDTTCKNDSNTIIKVRRDRQCSEWLACKSATEVFDASTNSFRQICDQVGTCIEYKPGSDIMNCAKWAPASTQRLEYGYYVNRSIDFDAADYTGYSMYNNYQVGTLQLVDVSNAGNRPDGRNPDYRLVRVVDICNSSTSYEGSCGPIDPLNPTERLGRCFATNKCVVGIDGSAFSRESDFVIKRSTRGWAEKDSPFPYSVVESEQGNTRKVKFGFQEAKVCDTSIASCEERYYKFQYGSTVSITKYFSADVQLSDGAIPSCLCQGGQRDNLECSTEDTEGAFACSNPDGTRAGACQTDNDCNRNGDTGQKCLEVGDGKLSTEERCPDNGSPLYLRRSESYLNWPGYCLEQDNRANINASQSERACLNWLPVDNAPVGYDFYNQNREAGYSYKAPAYYCLEVGLFERRLNKYLGYMCRNNCNNSLLAGTSGYRIVQVGKKGASCNGSWPHPNHTDCWAYPIGGEGLYPYDGKLEWHENDPENRPDGSCQILAKVVDAKGENAAMTNFFWSDYKGGTGYAIGDQQIGVAPFLPKLGYKLGRDDKPFGSAVPSGLGFVTDLLYIKQTREVPRAGSPYACSSNAVSCNAWDPTANSPFAVPGWETPYTGWGNENYTAGVRRLKEIYRKIFNLYKWGEGNLCDYMICGRTDESDLTDSGGYFGGQSCDPADSNSCNVAGNASCQTVFQKCVNSVFNDRNNPSANLTADCQACPAGFHTEPSPRKRCVSDIAFTDQTACEAGDLNLIVTGDQVCITNFGGTCQADPLAPTQWRCFTGDRTGNDCKIPANPDGTLVAAYLTCNQTTPGQPGTCFYMGEDTKVVCNSVSDCTARDDGDSSNTIGALQEINKTSFCADINLEGSYDYGSGNFCIGAPFSSGEIIGDPDAYLLGTSPVHCENNSTSSTTNALGYALRGYGPAGTGPDDVCQTHGICRPSSEVHWASGELVCKLQPKNGYLPLCNPDVEDCSTVDPDGERTIDSAALPLDITASSSMDGLTSVPSYAPYMIPAVCDASGVKCQQAIETNDFHVSNGPVPDYPVSPNDNGFSVNNILGKDPTPQNNIITGFQNILASLKFYMAADKNHMPIRYIELDWGDGLAQTRIGYYKNYLQQCGDPAAFGPITQTQSLLEYAGSAQACREAFRNYLHVYSYDPAYICARCSNDTNRACGRDTDCLNGGLCNSNIGIDGAASCYRPRVMLQDNWGWCTNGVYGITGAGCKDPQAVNSGQPPSPPSPDTAYVTFPGVIKVYKDPKP